MAWRECAASRSLLKRDSFRYRITVFGAEPHINYDRIMLSSVLAGEKEIDQIVINPSELVRRERNSIVCGRQRRRHRSRREDQSPRESGRVEPYDRLLIATGSRPIVPPIPGLQLARHLCISRHRRHRADDRASTEYKRAIVIGGGLLGLEAANGLLKRGMSVAVVHLMETLMERQLDAVAGGLLQRELDGRGLNFFMNGQTEEIFGEAPRSRAFGSPTAAKFPAISWSWRSAFAPISIWRKRCDLEINRGIIVDDTMRTSDPDIFCGRRMRRAPRQDLWTGRAAL